MKNSYTTFGLLIVPITVFACSSGGGGTGGSGGNAGSTTHTSNATGSGSTTTATGTPTNASSTGSGPIACTGMYTNIPKGDCDLLQQDCTNGNTCAVFQGAGGSSSISMCDQASPGLKGMGLSCATASECQKGLFCIAKTCTPVCCPDSGKPCGGGSCDLTVTFTGTSDFMRVCRFGAQCTLFVPNACTGGDDCHPEQGISTCSAPSGANIPEGGACQGLNDCGDMQACIGPQNGPFNCRYVCTPGSAAAAGLGGCPVGRTCNPTTTFGIDNLGICEP